MIRKVTTALLGVVLTPLLAVVIWVAPGQAATTGPEPVCATWGLRSITTGPGWLEDPAAGSSFTEDTATLTKPEGGGTEFAAFDLDITAPAGDELLVSVKYKAEDGAATTAGAVRLFGYAANDADTLTATPTYGPAIAGDEDGTLVLTLPAGAELGTLGVVYDASNSAGGHVTFSEMTIGQRPVSFTTCSEPSPSPTTPSPEPSASATTPAPVATTAPPVAGGPSLPVTGVNLQQVVTGAILLIIAGAVAWLVAPSLRRRRRTKFEA